MCSSDLSHGDTKHVLLMPEDPRECFEFGALAFDLADRLQTPVFVMNAPVAVDFRGQVDDVPIALSGDLGAPDKWLRQQWPYPVALKGDVDGKATKIDAKIARSGTTTSIDDLDVAYGPLAGKGSVRIVNEAARTRYVVKLAVPTLALADLAAPDRKSVV